MRVQPILAATRWPRSRASFLLMACITILTVTSRVGTSALGWHKGRSFIAEWRRGTALLFAGHLKNVRFFLLLFSSALFSLRRAASGSPANHSSRRLRRGLTRSVTPHPGACWQPRRQLMTQYLIEREIAGAGDMSEQALRDASKHWVRGETARGESLIQMAAIATLHGLPMRAGVVPCGCRSVRADHRQGALAATSASICWPMSTRRASSSGLSLSMASSCSQAAVIRSSAHRKPALLARVCMRRAALS